MRVKGLLAALILLTTACTPSIKLNVGDCLDRSYWVTESRELIGDTYLQVVAFNIDGGYIVNKCTVAHNRIYCELDTPLNQWIIDKEVYVTIHCPREI